jgi:hypothetical protein
MLRMVKYGRDNALTPMMGSSEGPPRGYYASVHAHLPELPAPMDGNGLAADVGTHARRDGRPQQDPAAVGVHAGVRGF